MTDAPPDIILTVPPCPSVNKLWRTGYGRARIRSPEYSAWIKSAAWIARTQLVGVPMISGTFDAQITVPITSRRDRDSWSKALFDLCQHAGAVRNDSGLREYSVTAEERDDVRIALWDRGGPEQRLPQSVRPIGARTTRPTAARIARAHKAGVWRLL